MTIHRTRPTTALLIALAGLALTLGLVAPAQAATTHKLTGTVTDSAGYPLAGIDVTLSSHPADEDESRVVGRARTDTSGRWTFKAAPAVSEKDYFLTVTDPTGRHVEQYTRSFALTRSTTKDLTLATAGFVQGQVSTKDGSAAAKPGSTVRVVAISADESATGDAKVAANGRFRMTGLPAGTYEVTFFDSGRTFEGLCYDGVPYPSGSDDEGCPDSTPVVVKAGRTTTLKPQVLTKKLGVVSGTVRDANGPVEADVNLYGDSQVESLGSARTAADGSFVVKGVRAGSVRMQVVVTSDEPYRTFWYRDATSFRKATVLTMPQGGTISDLRVTVPAA